MDTESQANARLLAEATLLRVRGHLDEAERNLTNLLGRVPGHAQAWRELGHLRVRRQDWSGAERAFEELLRLRPAEAGAWNDLGAALQRQLRDPEAEQAFRKALDIEPELPDVLSNLGLSLCRTQRLEEAEQVLRQAVALDVRYGVAWHNLALVHRQRGDRRQLLGALEKAVDLQPANPEFRLFRALTLLEEGRFEEGWPEWEWRWMGSPHAGPPPRPDLPRWNGEPLLGKRLLVVAEQGYGDIIQCLRFLPRLAALGPVALEIPGPLLPLVRSQGWPVDLFVSSQARLPADLVVPVMSLPQALRLHREQEFGGEPYLKADPERISVWRERFQ